MVAPVRARSENVSKWSTHGSTTRPSGRIAGWPAWSVMPSGSGSVHETPSSDEIRRWMSRYVTCLAVVRPRVGHEAPVRRDVDALVPVADPAVGILADGHGRGPRPALVGRVQVDDALEPAATCRGTPCSSRPTAAAGPTASRRTGDVSDGGPTSAGITTSRNGVHVRPRSAESASRIFIGRQPSVSGLKITAPGKASRSTQSTHARRRSPPSSVSDGA